MVYNDGVYKLVCNCVRGGDGHEDVLIYRLKRDIIELVYLDIKKLDLTDYLNWGINSTGRCYDAQKKGLVLSYTSKEDETRTNHKTRSKEFIHNFGIRDTRNDTYIPVEDAEKQGLLTQAKGDAYRVDYARGRLEWQYENLVKWFGKDFYKNAELTFSEDRHPWQENGEAYRIDINFGKDRVQINYDGGKCIVSISG